MDNREILVYGTLENWDLGLFVPVIEADKCHYGGYQEWLTEAGVPKFYADRSCGVTAATNLLFYLATNKPGMSKLCDHLGDTKAEYNAFQKELFDFFSPSFFGVPTINYLIKRVEQYSQKKGAPLKAVQSAFVWSVDNVRAYITKGLNSGCPVLILTWKSDTSELAMHWVTITRIFESDTGTKIVTSNWGEKRIYDFAKWVVDPHYYKGVVYFAT